MYLTNSPPAHMAFANAAQRHSRWLYHWQRFDAARLEVTLKDNTIYCSWPGDFNDPWDCRPFFNTEQLSDPEELQKHIDWAGVPEKCQRRILRVCKTNCAIPPFSNGCCVNTRLRHSKPSWSVTASIA